MWKLVLENMEIKKTSSSNVIAESAVCLSEGGISDCPVHLKWCHFHMWNFRIQRTLGWAVSSWSTHWAEARGGATHAGKTCRSWHSRTPQESAWCHQVSVALCVWEGVAWTTWAGAADAASLRWWRRSCSGLSHLEHDLKKFVEKRENIKKKLNQQC